MGSKLRRGFRIAVLAIPALSSCGGPAKRVDAGTSGAELAPGAGVCPACRLSLAVRPRRGLNLNGWLNGPTQEGRCNIGAYTSLDLTLISDLGFDFVRVPVDPELLFLRRASEEEAGLQCVQAVLDSLERSGLTVVVDPHPQHEYKRQILLGGEALYVYAASLERLAAEVANRPTARFALELLNEPFEIHSADTAPSWDSTQRLLWAAARRGAPDHTFVASGARWSDVDGLTAVRLLPDSNIIYTFHFYEPHIFTHQGANWGTFSNRFHRFLAGVPYPPTAEELEKAMIRLSSEITDAKTQAQALDALTEYGRERWNGERIRSRIQQAALWAGGDVCLLVGEFGVYRRKVLSNDRVAWLRDVRTAAEEFGIGWAMWEYRGGFGLLNEAGKPDTAIAAALGVDSSG